MKRAALLILAAASGALAQNWQPAVSNARFETRSYSGNLSTGIRAAAPTWFGYAVKSVRNDNESCCWNGSSGCWLERGDHRGQVALSSVHPVQLEGSDAMAVLFRVENNAIQKIRAYSLSCPLDAGGLPFVWLTGVPAHASLEFLKNLATDPADRKADGAIFAIAQHEGSEADGVLEALAQPAQPERVREKTAFWLGASRGARGTANLQRMLAADPGEHVRDKVVFALSISKQPEALDALIHAAKNDSSAHVRGQALFWLAQKAGKRATDTITGAIENDPNTDVKKKAIFALSQLPKDEGVPKLIEAARNQKNPEVRKQAFFWLGQSQDPRALAFIQDVLTK
jgi:hypothetical protein